ncbi:superinfection immunity protein [Paraburkholderia acidiphila]|uniref:Superinfection immunity protein n=1 Tax=Paraburkholderia acidiphila TaxID=2571747 RepID=A0A7Z2GDE6_9BURK|nr:superinfection immunity protein [Paraburkholderia acidiphila]QGZ59760.1 superinfection immunity protein [Paraburkholderia acidiphila]
MLQILEGASVIAALSLYLIPSIEADAREHKDAFAITMVNILLGWTIVGWFAARAWAHSRSDERRLPRAAKRVLRTAGRVTTQKLVQHAKLRTALESRETAAKRGAEVVYS